MSISESELKKITEKLKGQKSISEAAGTKSKELKQRWDSRKDIADNLRSEDDTQQAEIELAYICAAIAIAEGSNDIGADISIGPLTIGVSLNSRLVPILQAEAEEIEKYLRGEENNWE
jgi:hypothetical protein